MEISALEEKFTEILGQLQAAAVDLAPSTIEAGLGAMQLYGVVTILKGLFFFTIFVMGFFLVAKATTAAAHSNILNRFPENEERVKLEGYLSARGITATSQSMDIKAFGLGILAMISIVLGGFATLAHLTNTLAWIGIISPEAAIVYKILF